MFGREGTFPILTWNLSLPSRQAFVTVFLLTTLLGIAGCRSVSSTPLSRNDDDWFTTDRVIPYPGIPITLKVPTHVDVEIVETYYLQNVAAGAGESNGPSAAYADLVEIPMSRPNLNVRVTPVLTEKIFTVDFKRPLSGRLDYGMQFGPDQYFESIQGEVIDTTIRDIAALAKTMAPMLGVATAATPETGQWGDVLVDTRTVAYKRFDINTPDFEQQVLAFVERHLNACSHCAGFSSGEVVPSHRPLDPGPTPANIQHPADPPWAPLPATP